MENNNQIFKISKELYGDNTVSYNNIKLVALNRLDLGSSLSFSWGDTSTGSEALSYCILSKVGSQEIASRYAKSYTTSVISKIKKDDWTLNAIDVVQWINENTNYSIDENDFKNGSTAYEYEERRQEGRRKEERRIKREKDFQEEAQKRLKIYEAKQQERSLKDRRVMDRRVSAEEDFQERAQKRIREIQAQHQEELDTYKKQIIKQNADIQKYKSFIESLDIKSMYTKYCNLGK